ncbi:replication endonuclease, partial [Salmonella enterica]|nr:replication endonuclease [Salmonella enterica]EDS5193619.1 replication endonuclease [Salmonella enterica subsp. enterica serovar Thompson]EAR9950550.1 replication endonuclease [Salmonella enterica]EBN2675042.1 replication endonuclease [Salmonella enterica]ECQ9524377.1 replication endonuclease [Salmonella enterica]
NKSGGNLPDIKTMDEKELQEYLYNMGQKERRELTARLRLVKPKRKKTYIQSISEQQRLQLEAELTARGFDASNAEVDLLLRGGSIPSGAGLRLFYRDQRLQEDDKWRQWY